MALEPSGLALPSISPLPPIEMPDSPTSGGLLERDPSFLRRSSTSLASHNSFTTAMSSTSAQKTPPGSPDRPLSPVLHQPTQSLRKSISVDSFVKRDAPKIGPRPKRTNTDLTMQVPEVQPSGSQDYEHHALQRNRGVSFSNQGDYNTSAGDDLDLEPWPSQRRASLKGKDSQLPLVRPGELKLPPRISVPSSTSSTNSISTTPSNSRDEYRRLHATTSMQSIPGRIANPVLASISGRARSGSLGVKVDSGGKPIFINTQIPSKSFNESVDPVTVAVVGAPGAGKSTVIRKGAKQFSLSDFTVLSAPPGMLGVQTPLRYVRRIGHVTDIEILGEMTPSCPLHLLEIDIGNLGWDQPTSHSSNDSSAGAPQVDGVLICYDATSQSSFAHVEDLLKRLQVLKLPFMVLACKSDLERVVDPKVALDLLKRYDSGLVEATKESGMGKDRMRRSFEWLIKAILRDRSRSDTNPDYRNPASPDALASLPPWENPPKARTSTDSSVVTTPTASSSMASMRTVAEAQAQGSSRLQQMPTMPTISSPRPPSVPTSPTRARSMSDLLSEHEKLKNPGRSVDRIQNIHNNMMTLSISGSVSSDQLHTSVPASSEKLSGSEEVAEPKEAEQKPSRPTQWATLDELLDKLIFLAVSGDDPTFITHFLLTYRRFASPRSVLLAMQKRMRQLDNPSGDPMFACYAQMRICHLLEVWIRDYPYDFAVRGTAGALNALVKAVVAKTYLLHYGCEFLPFTELVIKHEDLDEAWALPVEDLADESDESYSLYDEEEEETPDESDSATAGSVDHLMANHRPPSIVVSSRENKSSLPLSNVIPGSLGMTIHTPSFHPDDPDFKKLLKDLVKNSLEIGAIDPALIAEEITRIEAIYFLDIQPRHWLHYTLASGKKDPEVDTIAKFNAYSNNLADWVVSLILCHDRPKNRARQIEKFIDIAQRLRGLNNYSALRAFVAGINNSTFPTDVTMELFKTKAPDMYKTFQSWDILFQAIRSHRAYRMALKSSKGACIPALEVHMSDLIRAHEGNAETNADYPNKIHWGKFNMIGKFVHSTTLCQVQCRGTQDYNFKENTHIKKLMQQSVMSVEMQRSRIAPPPEEPFEEPSRLVIPRTFSRDATSSSQSKDAAHSFRKLFAW